jgi:hypothetical protein
MLSCWNFSRSSSIISDEDGFSGSFRLIGEADFWAALLTGRGDGELASVVVRGEDFVLGLDVNFFVAALEAIDYSGIPSLVHFTGLFCSGFLKFSKFSPNVSSMAASVSLVLNATFSKTGSDYLPLFPRPFNGDSFSVCLRAMVVPGRPRFFRGIIELLLRRAM